MAAFSALSSINTDIQGPIPGQRQSALSQMSPIPHPSLSRDLKSTASEPALVHTLNEWDKSSVLSLAVDEKHIYSGSQCKYISVWDKKAFVLKSTLRGHTGSVLALEYARDRKWLFSASGDSTVWIWSTTTLTPVYVLSPYLETASGDLFSLAWSPTLQTIYVGCQNTSLQWYTFPPASDTAKSPLIRSSSSSSLLTSTSPPNNLSTSPSGTSTPLPFAQRKAHPFFDSYPQYERKPADIHANNNISRNRDRGRGTPDPDLESSPMPTEGYLDIPAENVIDSAHYGYVYCMSKVQRENEEVWIATGSGDESVKIWACTKKSPKPKLIHTFDCQHGAVLALVISGEDDTLYAGCQDGYVKVLDLETKTLVRTIIVQEGVDILSMSLLQSDLYTCSADGRVKRWSKCFDCTASWSAHNGISLSSIIDHSWNRNESKNKVDRDDKSNIRLITGGNDNSIKIWEIAPPAKGIEYSSEIEDDGEEGGEIIPGLGSQSRIDTMTYALSKFISIPSISSEPASREYCRLAAIWLRKCLGQLGAQTFLLPTGEGLSPLVLGTFTGTTQGDQPKRRILFYGHYDVIPAPPTGWHTPPFTLTGRNGCLYGRGVTDDKGPILAVAFAVAELLAARALVGVDVVFLVEGEEECGSSGFGECVRRHKDLIGDIDAILVSNSTWIAEDRPCITYGLRGVVHCTIEISSSLPDLHSGVEGGAVEEPMYDMIKLLATLSDNERRVLVPGFYDSVRPPTEEEMNNYELLSKVTQRPASSLSSKWREPSLTVHTIEISGPQNSTVIPGTVKAQISLRIVPDQDLDTIVKSLQGHLEQSFAGLESSNKLHVVVDHTADWWLGQLDDPWFKALENAVREEWNMEPLRIREGGSIPSVPWLEKEFGCHALHLPMGQSSDQAHLPNERISLVNFQKGRAVVERFLRAVAHI
ncbi:hypothetical protein AX16_008471 [Volvariella volvacea WC 439]|nr:hypothetical protein AX16_008471 [Volvariella volvacea WC 439]